MVLTLGFSFNDSLFFFFKKTPAYEMRISDWSSDVCSSDLNRAAAARARETSPSVRRSRSVAASVSLRSAQIPTARAPDFGSVGSAKLIFIKFPVMLQKAPGPDRAGYKGRGIPARDRKSVV